MRVGLIDPCPEKHVDTAMPPVGLACLAARLERDGHAVQILDVALSASAEVGAFIAQDFDLVGLTVTSASVRDAQALASRLRSRAVQIPVVVGGPHTSIAGAKVLEAPEFDFAAVGEGEETLAELIASLAAGSRAYAGIAGLVFRDESGRAITNPPRPLTERLDDLPAPSYASLDMSRYGAFAVFSSRGCPYECTFCAVQHIWGRRLRARSPESLVAEIHGLVSSYGRKDVIICDDAFNVDLDRALRFCDLLAAAALGVRWHCWSFRADRAVPVLLEAMKRSGCYSVSVGVESADPAVLRAIRKHETIEQIEGGIRSIQRVGIRCLTLNMIGNQQDTLETVKQTIAFNRRLGVDDAKFFMALPYPKTALWDYVEAQGRFLQKDYTRFHHFSGEPIFETDEFPCQQRRLAYRLASKASREIAARANIRWALRRVARGDFLRMDPRRLARAIWATLATVWRALGGHE